MACKKSELVTAINSFATARATGDTTLQQMSAQLLQNAVDSLEYEPEEEATTEEEVTEED